jgi:hypothetical protein
MFLRHQRLETVSSVFVSREKERLNRSSFHYPGFLKHICSVLASRSIEMKTVDIRLIQCMKI